MPLLGPMEDGAPPVPVSQEVKTFRNMVCLVVLVALLADFLLLTVIIPLVPVLLPTATSTPLQAGVLFAAKSTVEFIFSPIWGSVVDKVGGGRGVMFVGLLVAIAATAGFLFVEQFELLVICRGIQGIGSAATMTGGMSYVAQVHPPAERGAAAGTAMAGVALGVVFGPSLSGGLYHWLGLRGPFGFVLGMLGLAAIAQIALHLKEKSIKDKEAIRNTPDDDGSCVERALIFCDPLVLVLCLGVASTNAALAMVEPLIPRFMHMAWGLTPGQTGLAFSAVPFAYLVGTPIAGTLADKKAKYTLVLTGMVLVILGMPVMELARLIGDKAHFSEYPIGEGLPVLIGSLFLLGAGLAFVDAPSTPLVLEVMEYRRQASAGSAVAAINMSVNIGFVAGPLIGTAVSQATDMSLALAVFGAFVLVCAPFLCALSVVKPRAEAGFAPRPDAGFVQQHRTRQASGRSTYPSEASGYYITSPTAAEGLPMGPSSHSSIVASDTSRSRSTAR